MDTLWGYINKMKPSAFKTILLVFVLGCIGLVVWPDIALRWKYNSDLTEMQLINVEMTMRYMLLPQHKTTAVTFKSKNGTEFVVRAYPDDSLLVSNGKTLRWLASEQAVKEIREAQPNNSWMYRWISELGTVNIVYAGSPFFDCCHKKIGRMVVSFRRVWESGLIEACIWKIDTGLVNCLVETFKR